AIWLFIAVVALARGRPRRGELLLSVVFLFLGWWAVRNVAIAVAVTIPVVGRAVRDACSRSPRAGRADADPDGVAPPLLVVLVGPVNVLLVVHAAADPNFDLKRYPVASMNALAAEHRLGGRLLTT